MMKDILITWELLHERECGEIPERAHIIFRMANRKIDVRLRDSELHITSSDTLVIKPRASNCVRVSVE